NRLVKKTYWCITAKASTGNDFTVDQAILHKGKLLEAKTDFHLLKRSDSHELWQANPLTGRNHQIRIHAKAGGRPILGDSLYDGGKYPFLCLHNHRIQFPNGTVIVSKAPHYFHDLTLLKDLSLTQILFEADRRQRLFGETKQSCFRWVHTRDFSIDQYGEKLILNWNKNEWTSSLEKRFLKFSQLVGRSMVFKTPEAPVPESTWVVQENGYKVECRVSMSPSVGLGVGLLLNQRLQRGWVYKNSNGKSVLNLFAQNCGYGLAAASGHADSVICVDSNGKSLNWGKRNFELNALDPSKSKFLCRDSLVFLKQASKQTAQFDLIICDAPSFYRGEKGIFKIEKDLPELINQ
ncbi:MAG: class I SAM-dependent methyltransferase, partial [Pseudobdellovibrionaceae bacterium]